MFKTENVSVYKFVSDIFQTRGVQEVVADYKLENARLIEYVTKYLLEMGIYTVPSAQRQVITETAIHHLKHSPELHSEMEKIARAEQMRRRGRIIEGD